MEKVNTINFDINISLEALTDSYSTKRFAKL